jgi:SRSO17 transposase
MEQEELSCWAESFAEFCGRFDDLFARSETRQQAQKYVRGLLAPRERKTSWQLAEQLADSSPDRMQRLLSRAPMSMQMQHGIGCTGYVRRVTHDEIADRIG